ncbi:MAG: hypothetical protein BGO30_10535 [Bacteroidetes bacterium 41-46]|nr:MAG: hypothetical protein BGO30_10535 [Bacteroidetes bacterium 41-46]
MKKDIFKSLTALLIIICSVLSKVAKGEGGSIVLFWNLENLFIDSPYFYRKINDISKQIHIATEGELPLLIGFAEIGNFQAVWRLANVTALASAGYGIVHADSPDRRGIDVALLYRKDRFNLVFKRFYPIKNEKGEVLPTRLTIYAKGVLDKLDTLHLIVAHWPSKWGGERASIPGRILASKVMNGIIDSLLSINPYANIIAMGDMNEEAVAQFIPRLILLRPHRSNVPGTVRYNGRWETIDHILVSPNLMDTDEPIFCTDSSLSIYSHPLLLERDKAYLGKKPRRSFTGPRYNGGISDHLPLLLRIERGW